MPPSPDDVKRFLLASEKPKVRLAISMLYATGMRLDELCHLRCADIIHSSMKIYIRHSKNHSDRYVPLTESIWQMILDYWYTFPAPERPREWLFTQQTRLDHPMDKQWIQREVLLLRRSHHPIKVLDCISFGFVAKISPKRIVAYCFLF